MEDFKANPKMQCFKEGKQVKYESRKEHAEEMKADVNQDKKIVKKAFKMHDAQEHKGEKTDLSKLRKGGRAKKDCGTVRKYKSGGSVTNVYEAKKTSGDKDNIQKTKDIKPGKAAAPSRATERPNFEGSDVAKTNKMPAGDKDMIKKVKPTGNKKANAPSGAGGPDAYKKGGKVKKMADGSLTGALAGGALGGGLAGMVQDQERKRRIAKYLGPAQQAQLAAQQAQATAAQPPNASAMSAAPPQDQMGAPTGMPMQKRGGKVKKCAEGGSLKEVDAQENPGLSKLPTDVRNKMGYAKRGGKIC